MAVDSKRKVLKNPSKLSFRSQAENRPRSELQVFKPNGKSFLLRSIREKEGLSQRMLALVIESGSCRFSPLHPSYQWARIAGKEIVDISPWKSTICPTLRQSAQNSVQSMFHPIAVEPDEGALMKRPLLSVKEVQTLLNVSRRTVYHWVKQGILKPIEIGGLFRFHPDDIDALIEKNRHGGTQRKRRILAIDDDILVRESLKSILDREGFDVTVVSNGQEALNLLSNEVFDLILSDIRMPGMDGIETLKAIREMRSRFGKPPLPEIVITAYEDDRVREEITKLGIRDFILKPFDINDFLRTIRERLK